jgi:protease I
MVRFLKLANQQGEEFMAGTSNEKKIAFLLTNGVEQVELTGPRKALDAAGAKTVIVSPAKGEIQGMNHHEKGDTFKVEVPLNEAKPDDYDALVLPGGVANPDELRMVPEAVKFVRAFVESKKPIAAICHGPWLLIEAGAVRGHTLTSWPSLRTDIRNAGGEWVDREVVRDGQITTSRKPDDLPAFNRAIIEAFGLTQA